MNSLFINETALHTRLLRPPPPASAPGCQRRGDCPFWPPPWRSQCLVSESLLGTLLPQLVPETSQRARAEGRSKGACSWRGEPTLTLTSACALPTRLRLPEWGCCGRGSLHAPAEKGYLTGLPERPIRDSLPGDPESPTSRRRAASLTCALTGEPMLEKESAGEW